ncbi:MAG: hypothetical protein J6A52_04390 [Bacilli bacterium]|nr:hypothetical protein [Bacilli bacterium]
MEKGYINIDENEINDISGFLSRSESHITSVVDGGNSKFSVFKKSSLFGNGAEKITKQLSTIAGSVLNINKMVKQESLEMLELDKELAERAESIEVPMDFVTTDSVRNFSFNSVSLNKNDGKHVNGENTSNVSVNLESSVLDVNLKNINESSNIGSVDDIHINDSNYRNVSLNNVHNDIGLDNVELKQNADISRQELKNINNDSVISEMGINDSTLVENVVLNNINNKNIGDNDGVES